MAEHVSLTEFPLVKLKESGVTFTVTGSFTTNRTRPWDSPAVFFAIHTYHPSSSVFTWSISKLLFFNFTPVNEG